MNEEKYGPDDPRHYGYSKLRPRIWHGMTTWAWWRLIRGNLKDISPGRYGLVASVTAASLLNSGLALVERLIYRSRVERVGIDQPPVLILGFQRSGTTFLHELLACDPRFAYPDNLQCLMPETYLITEKSLRPLSRMMPVKKRPMDDVDVAPDAPQEDEVALLLSGVPSPYRMMAFPSSVDQYRVTLQQEARDETKNRQWKAAWLHFLKKVQFSNPGKRLLLKSPTHTVRPTRVLELFPKAKFIHITRDPYKIFQSNIKLGRALTVTQGLQVQAFDQDQITEELLSGFALFHEAFEQIKQEIPSDQIVTLAYEDLVRDPKTVMRRVYEELDLGDFAPLEAPLDQYLGSRKGYKTNVYKQDPEIVRAINERWGIYFDSYGYDRTDIEPPGAENEPQAHDNQGANKNAETL